MDSLPTYKEEIFLKERCASRRLGVPQSWLRDEARAGRVPCLLIGRTFYFDLDLVRASLAERQREDMNANHKTQVRSTSVQV